MKSFNLDTTFTKGKKTYSIVNNEIVRDADGWLSLSSVAANALIEHWLPIIEKQIDTLDIPKEFGKLLKEVSYLKEALSQVNHIKGLNCSYNNKSREELENKVAGLKSKFYGRINKAQYTQAQNLVIDYVAGYPVDVCSYDLQELYNVVTDDTSKLDKWWKDLNSFNYKKYGVSKSQIVDEVKSTYEATLTRISNFRTILNEAGDDLLNWSDQKITLRFTKLRISSRAWEISSYLRDYKAHLESKGIVKVDKKKSTSKGKLEDIIENGEPTQDDYFRYYKQADSHSASGVIVELDLEHLYLIIESNLKCVTSKLEDRFDRKLDDFKKVALALCEKSVTKQDYKKIIKWAKPLHVTEAFMIKHKDHATQAEVVEYCENASISAGNLINEEFYQTCLVKIPPKVKYTLNEGLTFQYMVRMNDNEKITMLKELAREDNNNHTKDSTLHGLYDGVDYNSIKDTILNDDALMVAMCGIVISSNDNASMITCAKSVGNQLMSEHKIAMFQKLSFVEKKEVIKADKENNNFTGAIKLLTNKESLELLSEIIEDGDMNSYVTAIFKQLVNQKNNQEGLVEANKIVKAMENPDYLPLHGVVISSLTVGTRLELLDKRIGLKDNYIYYDYYDKKYKTSSDLGKLFFNDFKREDIDKVYDSPLDCEFRKFLGHLMSRTELEECSNQEITRWHKKTNKKDLQESFLRHNLEFLSYGFLKQFKDKESFRIVVGDKRDSINKSFGCKLLAKLNVTQTIDFMFGN